jgi:dsRNA-specific ribonuclease
MPKMKKRVDLKAIQKKLGYTFKNKKWLIQALEPDRNTHLHQRMENLGDAYLEVVIREWADAHFKYDDFNYYNFISRACSNVVLALVAEQLGIVNYISKTYSQEEEYLVKEHANIVEAILCAIKRDGGMTAVKKVVLHIIPLAKLQKTYIASLNGSGVKRDAKAALAKWASANKSRSTPKYTSQRIGSNLILCTLRFRGRVVKAPGDRQEKAEYLAAYWMLFIVEQDRLRKILFK